MARHNNVGLSREIYKVHNIYIYIKVKERGKKKCSFHFKNTHKRTHKAIHFDSFWRFLPLSLSIQNQDWDSRVRRDISNPLAELFFSVQGIKGEKE